MTDKKLLVIAGPTASGKTGLSVRLARELDGEVISADSMQIYKYMDIGSAKATEEEMMGIPHHMIGIADPFKNFDVVMYRDEARKIIADIQSKGKLPILTGGTGMYIDSVIRNISYGGFTGDEKLRKELEETAALKGNEYLHSILKEVDPDSQEKIHMNNVKRVIRAIEVTKSTGKPFSSMQKESRDLTDDFKVYYFYLNMERDLLYSRIEKRADIMMEKGLLQEVKSLMEMGLNERYQSMQGIGYKELIAYLKGKVTLEEAKTLLKQHTRNYAKRQLTWFRNDPYAKEISLDTMSLSSVVEYIKQEIMKN